MATQSLKERYRAARRVGTPLIAVETADQAAAVATLTSNGNAATIPAIVWDVVQGWRPLNQVGNEAMAQALETADPEEIQNRTLSPVDCLMEAQKLPQKAVLFMRNAHKGLTSDIQAAPAVQALWNLRDTFKADFRTVVLLGPSFALPPEVAGDVLVIDEPLPDDEQLSAIVAEIGEAAGLTIDDPTKERAVDALRGLAAFPAEQVTALSATKDGLDLDGLWERKRQMISSTPGLSVWRGGETFDDIGGNAQVIGYLKRVLKGKEAPRCVVFIDEIEKMLAGATGVGDSSGVSQGQLQALLTWMQDFNVSGMIFIGPPGAGKSAVAKCVGAAGGIPTIAFDGSGMKASLVGESEQRMASAIRVVNAVGGGQVLVIATCNKIANLPPELRRRFTLGTFFFDLPDADERSVIWQIYREKYGLLKDKELPKDDGWTGAEIKQACLLSYRLGIPLTETAQYIVPVSVSAKDQIQDLRFQAARRFLSASHPGLYELATQDAKVTEKTKRAIAQQEV